MATIVQSHRVLAVIHYGMLDSALVAEWPSKDYTPCCSRGHSGCPHTRVGQVDYNRSMSAKDAQIGTLYAACSYNHHPEDARLSCGRMRLDTPRLLLAQVSG